MAREIGSRIHDRYLVRELLGEGGFATTYRCDDTSTGRAVAVKELHLHRVEDWKSVELFEREARVLAGLAHPGIPTHLDSFRVEEAGQLRSFCLVQGLASGASLAQRLRAGELFDETRARDIALQVLDILAYLHDLAPPVTHRDIKPANLVLDDTGGVQLVDFGAVRVSGGQTGSTVAGTFGYMAPEQFQGKASPASDVYALAATLVHLLSGKAPDTLPTRRLRLDFRPAVQVSAPFATWLDACLEPVVEDRPASARAARALLTAPPASLAVPRATQRPALVAAGVAAVLIAGAASAALVISRAPEPVDVPVPAPYRPAGGGAPAPQPPQPPPPPAAPRAPTPPAARVCTPLPKGKCRVACTIDVIAGTTDCPSTLITPTHLQPGSGALRAQLTGMRGLELTAHICDPRGFTLHVADSPTNNGYGGDSASRSNDAELQIVDRTLTIFGSDNARGARLYEDGELLGPQGCQDLRLYLGDSVALAEQPCMTVRSDGALRLDPPSDREGPPDSEWYLGLNRVVAGGRSGSGLQRLALCVR